MNPPVQAMRLCLSAQELDVLIAGELRFDLDDWQQNTLYEQGYTSESPQVMWFWELLREWEPRQLSNLLSFVTGLVPHRGVSSDWLVVQGRDPSELVALRTSRVTIARSTNSPCAGETRKEQTSCPHLRRASTR